MAKGKKYAKKKLIPATELIFTAKNGTKFFKMFSSIAMMRKAKRAWMAKGGPMPRMSQANIGYLKRTY